MQIREIMTRDVHVASPSDSLEQAARIMAEFDIGVLPVGEDDRLVGMVTDRDIAVRGTAEGKTPDAKVRDVMSAAVRYCYEDETTDHVAHNMGDLQIRWLPVVNRDKRLVGIVSLGDLATEPRAQEDSKVALAEISVPAYHGQPDLR